MGIGGLLGLGAGLAGISSIIAGMKQAVDLAGQNEQIQEATLVILRNQREIRHENSQLAFQDLKTLNQQAVSLQQQTGLYKNVFERGSLILAQSRMTVGEIKSMQFSMANLLAAQRMQGKNAEQMEQTYKAIGMAIERGMGRSLSRTGVILTPMEQRMLTMNAMIGNIAGNMRIVEGAINRTYAGMAKLRMQTLTGRTELALANMQLSLERIGDVLRPIGQRLTIIFTRLIPLIEPVVTRLAVIISDSLRKHMKDIAAWMDLIRKQGIPLMIEWINKGWIKIKEFIVWFKQNQDWIVPWIKYIAIFTGLAVALGVVLSGVAFIVENALVVSLVAVGAAILAAITNFHEFKTMLSGLGEWLMGTKRLDPQNKGFGYMRAFRKGVVPRAQPVQGGWLGNLLDPGPMDKWMTHFIDQTIPRWWKKISKFIGDMMAQGWAETIKWFTIAEAWIGDKITGMVKKITDAFQLIWEGFDKFLLNPMKVLSDLWQQFLKSIGVGTADPQQAGLLKQQLQQLGALPGGKDRTGGPAGGGGGLVWKPTGPTPAGGLRALNFGPLTDPRSAGGAYYSDYGSGALKPGSSHLRALMPSDIAMSPSLLQGSWGGYGGGANAPYKMGQWGKIVDVSTGKTVPGLERARIADTSWIRTGKPTYNTIEQRKYKDLSGRFKFVPEGVDLNSVKRGIPTKGLGEASAAPVNINYNVTNHIHGGEDLEHRMAAVHRRHLDQLSRDLAAVQYRHNRAAFDGAQAV
jgi:hypothetical protein